MSRRTWERHRNKARDASVSAVTFFLPEDGLATPAGGAGTSAWAFGPKEGKRTYVLADGDHGCCRQTYIGVTSFIGRSGQKLARAA